MATDSKNMHRPTKPAIPNSCRLSIIICTQNYNNTGFFEPARLKNLVPDGISSEIIVVRYNQSEKGDYSGHVGINQDSSPKEMVKSEIKENNGSTVKIASRDKFSPSVIKGLKSSSGQFILVLDADFPYPEEIITKIMEQLKNHPNSIIIASKYATGQSVKNVPFIRSNVSKAGRLLVKHGLRVKGVKDPLSSCFAIPSELIKRIPIEGTGDELLLEILVKLKAARLNDVTITEIPYNYDAKHGSKKLDTARITSYLRDVWNLYRYGQEPNTQSDMILTEPTKHKSISFLSKAGRFFTVGASGLAVNFLVSLIFSNLVPNVWYIQATMVGVLASISSNFLLNKIWTFEDRDFSLRHVLKQYLLFLILCSLGAVVQLSLVFAFVEYSNITYPIALIMAVIVASLSNFLLNKKITFGEKIWG